MDSPNNFLGLARTGSDPLQQRVGRGRSRRRSRVHAEPRRIVGDPARRRGSDAARRSSNHDSIPSKQPTAAGLRATPRRRPRLRNWDRKNGVLFGVQARRLTRSCSWQGPLSFSVGVEARAPARGCGMLRGADRALQLNSRSVRPTPTGPPMPVYCEHYPVLCRLELPASLKPAASICSITHFSGR